VPRKAEKLLGYMRQSTAKWTRRDLDTLYLGYGFKIRGGRKHDVASHPEFPQLRATLPKHSSLAKGYISYAVKLIDELEKMKNTKGG